MLDWQLVAASCGVGGGEGLLPAGQRASPRGGPWPSLGRGTAAAVARRRRLSAVVGSLDSKVQIASELESDTQPKTMGCIVGLVGLSDSMR